MRVVLHTLVGLLGCLLTGHKWVNAWLSDAA